MDKYNIYWRIGKLWTFFRPLLNITPVSTILVRLTPLFTIHDSWYALDEISFHAMWFMRCFEGNIARSRLSTFTTGSRSSVVVSFYHTLNYFMRYFLHSTFLTPFTFTNAVSHELIFMRIVGRDISYVFPLSCIAWTTLRCKISLPKRVMNHQQHSLARYVHISYSNARWLIELWCYRYIQIKENSKLAKQFTRVYADISKFCIKYFSSYRITVSCYAV